MPKYTKEDRERAEKRLREVLRLAPCVRDPRTGSRSYSEPRQKIYLCTKHVSRSGMRREISIYAHDGEELTWLSWSASRLLGWSLGKHDGVMVDGCGMDMGFHLVDCLARTLFGKDASANDFDIRWL